MQEDPAYLCSNRSQNAPLLTPRDAHDAEATLHNLTAFDRVENLTWRQTATAGNEQQWREHTDGDNTPARPQLIRKCPMLKCPTFSSPTPVSLMYSPVALIRHVFVPFIYVIPGPRFRALALYTFFVYGRLH